MTKSHAPFIQLHYACLDLLNDKGFKAKACSWLSIEEWQRYQRFASVQQANQFLLARALLRSQLSKQVSGVSPEEWVFVADKNGKPRLADEFAHLNIHFNLSHSENLVALALSEGWELGVDIEYIPRPVFSMALANRYFAEAELVELKKLDGLQQSRQIAQLWTLKESLLKASGLGIRVSLSRLVMGFEYEKDLKLLLSPELNTTPLFQNEWLMSLFSLEPDYSLALTIKAAASIGIPEVRIQEWIVNYNKTSNLTCELQRKKL